MNNSINASASNFVFVDHFFTPERLVKMRFRAQDSDRVSECEGYIVRIWDGKFMQENNPASVKGKPTLGLRDIPLEESHKLLALVEAFETEEGRPVYENCDNVIHWNSRGFQIESCLLSDRGEHGFPTLLFVNKLWVPMATECYLAQWAEGGIGSHPMVFTHEGALAAGLVPQYEEGATEPWGYYDPKDPYGCLGCMIMGKLPHQPTAIAFIQECATGKGDVIEIDPSLARVLLGYGKDTFHREDPFFNDVVSLIGWEYNREHNGKIYPVTPDAISIVLYPQLNVIYWSDSPEMTHSFWTGGLPTSIESRINF